MTTIDEATIEQLEAALEAKRADPWAAAVSRYMDAADVPYADREAVKAGLIAALPLAPRQVEAITCAKARELHGDDMPRYMASSPGVILRSYGPVLVTQEDIDEAGDSADARKKCSRKQV
jgi:hypothetical protein